MCANIETTERFQHASGAEEKRNNSQQKLFRFLNHTAASEGRKIKRFCCLNLASREFLQQSLIFCILLYSIDNCKKLRKKHLKQINI
jgi:hypothetical protein